jgi:hypothetical protein
MGHFCKVVDGKVTQVIVAEKEFFDTFVDSSPGQWLQCSYNTRGGIHYGQDGQPDGGVALRGNYPGIGYSYDYINDVFIPPKPYASWTLNSTTWGWDAPVAKPTTGGIYNWDEATKSWVELPVPEENAIPSTTV